MVSVQFKEASAKEDYLLSAELFKEYANQLGINLEFQGFTTELENIQEIYSRPGGALILAYFNKELIGCAGIRKFENSICELKRMYLRQTVRGHGVGKALLQKSITLGRELNYTHMRLDTLPTMTQAIKLYEQVGFYEIQAYRFNPIEGTKYFELILSN